MGNRGPVFFEEWAFLARIDSALFESRRQKAIQDILNSTASSQQRAAGATLQREIDRAIAQAGDPETTMMQIAAMMHAHLEHLLENLTSVRESLAVLQQTLDSDDLRRSQKEADRPPDHATDSKEGKQ